MRYREKRRIRQRWLAVERICLLIAAAMLILIANRLIARARIANEEQSAAAVMESISTPAPAAAIAGPSAEPTLQPAIAKLMEQNPDAVGLLQFDGSRTMYVCQAEDNVWYMDHRFDGSEDPAGMIYMDFRNSLRPRSDNLILYGHNMADGSRFGTLKRFQDIDYLLKNPVFTLADRYETVEYVPFAIFNTTVLPNDPAYFPFDQTDFATEADFNAYVEAVHARSIHYLPGSVRYGDRLLTLATCSNAHDRGRLVIVCREEQP